MKSWCCHWKAKSNTVQKHKNNKQQKKQKHMYLCIVMNGDSPLTRVTKLWPKKNLTPGVNGKTVPLWPSKPNSVSKTFKTSRSTAAAMGWNSWGDRVPACLLKHPVAVCHYVQIPSKKFLGKNKLFFHGKNVSRKPYLLFHQEHSTIYFLHALSTNMQTFVWGQAATSYSSLPQRTRLEHRCTSCWMPLLGGFAAMAAVEVSISHHCPASRTFSILNLNLPDCT